MFDRFSRQIRYVIIGATMGAVLMSVGLIGKMVITLSNIPSAFAVPFQWVGQLGAAILMAVAIIILIRLVFLFG